MQEQVESLFKEYAGVAPDRVEALPLSGSARRYWRLWQGENSCVGVYNEDTRENELFLDFSRHFHGKGLHVPEIYQVALDRKVYLQQDLGKDMLLDVVERERSGQNLSEHTMMLYKKALDELLRFQLEGTVGLDYSNCLPRPEFDARCMYWDLNYFKYCFLKLANVGVDENKLEDDFERLVGHLSKVSTESFMFRDFQSRNIMVLDDEVYFIDYQGGRKGALQYDVASLLYDAIVRMPGGQREELLDYYLGPLLEVCPERGKVFRKTFYHFVLVRLLQALGAFGLRGLYEGKQHFLDSILPGICAVLELFAPGPLADDYPEIRRVAELAFQKYFVPLSTEC